MGSANAKRERHGGALKVFSPVHKRNARGLRAGIDVKRGASGLVQLGREHGPTVCDLKRRGALGRMVRPPQACWPARSSITSRTSI